MQANRPLSIHRAVGDSQSLKQHPLNSPPNNPPPLPPLQNDKQSLVDSIASNFSLSTEHQLQSSQLISFCIPTGKSTMEFREMLRSGGYWKNHSCKSSTSLIAPQIDVSSSLSFNMIHSFDTRARTYTRVGAKCTKLDSRLFEVKRVDTMGTVVCKAEL